MDCYVPIFDRLVIVYTNLAINGKKSFKFAKPLQIVIT